MKVLVSKRLNLQVLDQGAEGFESLFPFLCLRRLCRFLGKRGGGGCGGRVVLRVFVLICSLQIDKTSSYRIDLVGRIEGRGQALVFQYRMNGGEFHTQLSMQQQTVRPVLHILGLISDGS